MGTIPMSTTGSSIKLPSSRSLICKLSFPGAKIARAMRDLLDPFAGADRKVSHLNVGVALAVLLCPAAVKRRRDTRSGPHQNNRILGFGSGALQAESKRDNTQTCGNEQRVKSLCPMPVAEDFAGTFIVFLLPIAGLCQMNPSFWLREFPR